MQKAKARTIIRGVDIPFSTGSPDIYKLSYSLLRERNLVGLKGFLALVVSVGPQN